MYAVVSMKFCDCGDGGCLTKMCQLVTAPFESEEFAQNYINRRKTKGIEYQIVPFKRDEGMDNRRRAKWRMRRRRMMNRYRQNAAVIPDSDSDDSDDSDDNIDSDDD
jgi:hypothetical protein